jgi:prophage regulatory protein
MTTQIHIQTPHQDPMAIDSILRWPDVQKRVGICRSHAHQLIARNQFPAPIKLGPRASGWLESEINAWIAQRIHASRNTITKNNSQQKTSQSKNSSFD